jgi:hypothetical protein
LLGAAETVLGFFGLIEAFMGIQARRKIESAGKHSENTD